MSRLVMTLLVKNEADIISGVILFHLSNGVDHIIVTDNGSEDGTLEIVERFVKTGVVDLIHEPGEDFRQSEWVTRMALQARDMRGADWIINSDADEFWHHASGDLKNAVERRPDGLLRLYRRNMLPPLDEDMRDQDRTPPVDAMTLAVHAPTNERGILDLDRYLLRRLLSKVICSAPHLERVETGNHSAKYSVPATTHELSDTVIYHYPLRSYAQFETKVAQGGAALARNSRLHESIGAHWREWFGIYQRG